MARIALTRPVPRSIVNCELTHLERTPISWERASAQHAEYEAMLRALGCDVVHLPGQDDQPDSVFIEDTALVFDEVAVITHPGAESRRGEVAIVADALRAHRRTIAVAAPGTLDGGDVLRVGRLLYVGMSGRSNADGARQLADALWPFGYSVAAAELRGALHLKTAVSTLPDGRLLLNPLMVDGDAFDGAQWLEVDPSEPMAANVLVVGETVLCPAAAPLTQRRLEAEGYQVVSVDASELAKAEGGLTCCSLIFDA